MAFNPYNFELEKMKRVTNDNSRTGDFLLGWTTKVDWKPSHQIISTNTKYLLPQIETVIFNDPATIIYFTDGTKTVVKCQEGDTYDKEKGLAMALLKRFTGNNSSYNDLIKKWVR